MSDNTSSSYAVNELLRNRLLDFTPPGGPPTLRTRLGGRVYFNRPSEKASYPYAVVNLRRLQAGSDSNHRDLIALEVTLYGRDEAQAELVETCADQADQAFTRFASYTDGLVFGATRTRDNVPPFTQPVDRQEYIVRCLYNLVSWPAWLAAVTTYA